MDKQKRICSKFIICTEVERWLVKLTEFAEIDKFTSLIKDKKKALSTFTGDWKILMDLSHKNEKNKIK